MLTNFVTIRSRVTYMEELEAMEADGRMATLPKKEQIGLRKELDKLKANLNGVRAMKAVPQAIFVVDTKREEIAIHEAHRLGIPVIGIIDTNADPDEVDFGIPANDDAIRSVSLLTEVIADAVLAGAGAAVISEAEMIGAPDVKADAAPIAAEATPVAVSVPVETSEPTPVEAASAKDAGVGTFGEETSVEAAPVGLVEPAEPAGSAEPDGSVELAEPAAE
jgi:small subunit ribosomal protein S2